jgi:flavin-binding protein dodecin
MSIARSTEITSSSGKSLEDAIEKGIKHYADTNDDVLGLTRKLFGVVRRERPA